ncbi:MAG: squalene/phytoene synthase family protein [Ramlibacter sp.]|jgi:farnesyl-diphosphate farnesyltransferase|nr:squalene/phytoene synthase family protein [Ramlibacter sp.]
MQHTPPNRPDPLAPRPLALLRGVSRSFGLSIRILPPALRQPMAVAYLLARATDTVADTAALPGPQRAARLDTLAAAIQGDAVAAQAVAANAPDFAALQQDPHEQALMLALPQCLAWLQALPPADVADIREVLRHITAGQALDIARFDIARFENPPAPANAPRALASAAELEDYAWRVAGCVGEFWTRLCLRHLPGYANLPDAHMLALGRELGMGLQLVNILRDAGADLAQGRCYLPADELAAAGTSPAALLAHPEQLDGVYRTWLARARQLVVQGAAYADAVNHRRVRAAVALPALLGLRTLALLDAAGTQALHARIKVPRSEVRGLMAGLALTLAARGPLASRFRRLGA